MSVLMRGCDVIRYLRGKLLRRIMKFLAPKHGGQRHCCVIGKFKMTVCKVTEWLIPVLNPVSFFMMFLINLPSVILQVEYGVNKAISPLLSHSNLKHPLEMLSKTMAFPAKLRALYMMMISYMRAMF